MKKPMTATLEWDGSFLRCNNLPVADVCMLGPKDWLAQVYGEHSNKTYRTESAARRAVNRRFGLKD